MLYIVKQIFYQDWSAFSVPGSSWPIHTTPFWLSEGVWLDFFPQSSVLAESLWLLSPSNFDSIMQMGFLWRLSGNFKIIILIKHAATKSGQRSSASLWGGNWAGAPERGLPVSLIYIYLLVQMTEQDWILFNFHALQWNLCLSPPFTLFHLCVQHSPVSTETHESSQWEGPSGQGLMAGAGWRGRKETTLALKDYLIRAFSLLNLNLKKVYLHWTFLQGINNPGLI